VPTIEVVGDQNNNICTIYCRPAKKQGIELPSDMSLHCSRNELKLPDSVLLNVKLPTDVHVKVELPSHYS
jgi:hypothetical protein